MERILDVAQFIFDEYFKITATKIDEMKLQKLLYFAQRESFAITGEPLFKSPLKGWKYGPVSQKVRSVFTNDTGINATTKEISPDSMYIIKNVILTYGKYASWKLSEMSHQEISWKNSRIGLNAGENGHKIMKLEDIKKDAEKVRPYDHIYDMYYDEFADSPEELFL
jgi:uncharacterized phage-associated protein